MNAELNSLADEYWEYHLRTHPSTAHMQGDYRFIDQVEDGSREAEVADIAARRAFAARARAIDPSQLDAAGKITRETLIFETESPADVSEMRQAEFGIDPIFGLQAVFQVAIPQMTVETTEHAEMMLDKYRGIATMIDQSSQRLREGLASGRVNAEFAVSKTIEQIDAILDTPADQSVFVHAQTPESFSEDEKAAWQDKAAAVVSESIFPAFERYRDLLRDEIAPVARSNDEAGLKYLPDGDLVYTRLLQRYTTLPMQAEEIHQIGLAQIARLDDEYREIAGPILGTTDLAEIYKALREDPDLHHTAGEGVVKQSEDAFAAARAAMGDWFGILPRSDCYVQETKHGAVAFYYPPAEDGSREGTFFMNTADPTSWGTYEVQATAFHEGIPGHHLQLAIAMELGDKVPSFQRHALISAYAEGWGLYTERLADEMGLYSSELDRVGMLSADSMRACRLVVDTGMHALGWSRDKGIEYMLSNSPMARHAVEEEIDRYLSFPGQAVSYMIGRIEIQRMRAEAEARLGPLFDIKGFHDTVLGSGLVTLPTLDRMVSEWVEATMP